MTRENVSRRRYLQSVGLFGSTVAVAGCVGSDDADDENGTNLAGEDTPNGNGTENGDDSGSETEDTTTTAKLHTSKGDIRIELYEGKVPETVGNFVGLATGAREWTHPETEETMSEPLYENVLFHRVIDGFMIQTGDPLGTGGGGPGYTFDDEFHPELRHDDAGIVSMANRGPDTNGSQFFITLAPQPHLDDAHAVFGSVIDGMEVVEEIGSVDTDAQDRPIEDVLLESVSIED